MTAEVGLAASELPLRDDRAEDGKIQLELIGTLEAESGQCEPSVAVDQRTVGDQRELARCVAE